MTAGRPADVPALTWREVFRGEERELSRLRRWLRDLLPECEARDDVTTVACELVTNGVQHTASGRGGWIVVEITWQASLIRVAVADQGAPGEPRPVDDPGGERGRGLRLVAGLSARWSVSGDDRGRLVCADVPWSGPGASMPAGFGEGYEAALRDGAAQLACRHAGTTAWFGRATQQWWALARGAGTDGQLVTAKSPQELDRLLKALSAEQRQERMAAEDAVAARADRRRSRLRVPVSPRVQRAHGSGRAGTPSDGSRRPSAVTAVPRSALPPGVAPLAL